VQHQITGLLSLKNKDQKGRDDEKDALSYEAVNAKSQRLYSKVKRQVAAAL
jgi:hypothetical protein